MTAALQPGSTLGVLGGGQLGRMFALAAHRIGFKIAVYSEDEDAPASMAVDRHFRAPYDDLHCITQFARAVDVVTFEFENVPAAAAAAAARHAPVRPAGELLHTTQNRQREKRALRALGLPVADYAEITVEADLPAAAASIPGPSILKTAAWGYDGRGQRRLASAKELPAAWQELAMQPAVVEALVPFTHEISVVGARGLDGSIAVYEPFENRHVDQILDLTLWPARVAAATSEAARQVARTVLASLEVVGVICVEMFVLADGGLLVNEIAPRPHNSGHLTIDAHVTSQFEQQVRAIAGLPLGDVSAIAPTAAMANLLGDLWSDGTPAWHRALSIAGARLHLYGKREARPGRKMGHITATGANHDEVERLVQMARRSLRPRS